MKHQIQDITIYHGNSDQIIPTIKEKVHTIITDPPYELGFMGKGWDKSGIAFSVDFWRKAYDKLEPGGYLLAFGGTRTYHRMAVAIEDAGFEIRDSIHWTYGSGFPKSLNVSKAIDAHFGLEREVVGIKEAGYGPLKKGHVNSSGGGFSVGTERSPEIKLTVSTSDQAKQWEGWGTALKPSHEPILVARKPLAEKTVALNVLKYGTGGINIDAGRVGDEILSYTSDMSRMQEWQQKQGAKPYVNGFKSGSLKKTVQGRWPSNTIHDGSEAVLACFPETKSGKDITPAKTSKTGFTLKGIRTEDVNYGDEGSAARFFKACSFDEEDYATILYFAKASQSDRDGEINNHPTVKPKSIMRYLVKLFTPPGGTVLDIFAGSGTTLVGCVLEGFKGIGIELGQENNNIEIIKHRVKRAYNHELDRQTSLFS